jgi:MtN3 and saliva related transmembrane protein
VSDQEYLFLIEVVGYIGATMTTLALFPQTLQVIKTRDTQSISLAMYILFTLGVCFWLVYGLLIQSFPVVIANTITVVLSAIILLMKLKEPKKSSAQRH